MSWSKVQKGEKPLWWWFHKIMCELAWAFRNCHHFCWKGYYYHLNKMCEKYHFNLYGMPWV